MTGAGSVGPGWGNGRATAVLLAREGARVFAVDRDAASMEETCERIAEFGCEIVTHVCDVTQSEAVRDMIDVCRAHFGRIDILVNNVGASAPGGPVEMDEAVWNEQMNVNLKSTFLCCKYVLPIMVEQRGGAIVNVASTSGLRWSGSPQVAYAVAKAGVIQFSRVVAAEYGPHGIRVNTVVPGMMSTPMIPRLAADRMGGDVEALLASRVKRVPLGFLGDGRDTAAAILFLASDEARFITGTELVIDGGMIARCD